MSNVCAKLLVLALNLSLVFGLVACSSAKPEIANQKTPPANLKPNTDEDIDEDPIGGGNEQTLEREEDSAKAEALTSFCQKAAETEAVKHKLSEYLNKFCQNGEPTSLFADSLIRGAWDGGANDPKFSLIEPWDSDPAQQTTTGYFAITVKLPVPIATYFEVVGPLAGDVATINKLTEAGGATPEVTTIHKNHSQEGKYHIRGWTIEQKSSEDIEAGPGVNFKIVTHVTSRSDQHELQGGSAYLFTSYMTNPENAITIKRFDTLSAGLQVKDDSYFIGIARVTSENKSFPEAAKRAIRAKAIDFIKNIYKMANAANSVKATPTSGTNSNATSSTATAASSQASYVP